MIVSKSPSGMRPPPTPITPFEGRDSKFERRSLTNGIPIGRAVCFQLDHLAFSQMCLLIVVLTAVKDSLRTSKEELFVGIEFPSLGK